jgi:hypothetical protein
MSEQLKQQTLYNVSEANTKNLIWVDVYVSGTEGSAGTYASRRMTKAQLITFLNSNLSVAWSTIASKPTTVAGFGITDAVDTLGLTANYVTKASDSNTLTDSTIRDNGTVGINVAPNAAAILYIDEKTNRTPLYVTNTSTGGSTGNSSGGSFINSAVNAYENYGLGSVTSGSTLLNIAVSGRALSVAGSVETIGGAFSAEGTSTARYAVKLQDGTQGAGKFLKCLDSDGKANWADIVVNPRVQTVASSATVTPVSTNDLVTITAQAVGLTLANPTGSFVEGQALMIRIKDNGTARTIAFGADYRAIGITLPTTTMLSKTLYLGVIYNSTDGKWDIVGLNQQA